MNYHIFSFNFSPDNIKNNEYLLSDLLRNIDKGSIEQVEKLFNVTFASGIENGAPYYLTLSENDESLIERYDGIVDLSLPPMDNDTREPFKKSKLTFRLEYYYNSNGYQTGLKTYINSNFRNYFKI